MKADFISNDSLFNISDAGENDGSSQGRGQTAHPNQATKPEPPSSNSIANEGDNQDIASLMVRQGHAFTHQNEAAHQLNDDEGEPVLQPAATPTSALNPSTGRVEENEEEIKVTKHFTILEYRRQLASLGRKFDARTEQVRHLQESIDELLKVFEESQKQQLDLLAKNVSLNHELNLRNLRIDSMHTEKQRLLEEIEVCTGENLELKMTVDLQQQQIQSQVQGPQVKKQPGSQ